MKPILWLTALLLTVLGIQAASTNIPGIVFPNKLTTGNSGNTYPLADTMEIRGTEKQVADTTERDAIPSERRTIGMVAYVVGEAKSYRLVGGVANANWVEVVSSGNGSVTNGVAYVFNNGNGLWYPLTSVSNEQGVVLSLGQTGIASTNWASPSLASGGSFGVAPGLNTTVSTNGDGTIFAVNALSSVDAGGVPYSGELDITIRNGHRGLVHPNCINLNTNWNGAQYWMVITGAGSNLTTLEAFEWVEEVHVFSSPDMVTWTPIGPQPIITRSNAVALAGLYESGWTADPEIYLAPDGVMRILYMTYAASPALPVAGFVSNAVMCASSADGSNWTHQVLRYGPQSISGTNINVSIAGPQVVRDHTNGLRLYFVDEGLDTSGTNVLKYVPAVVGDESGTNWNWAGMVSCTLTPYQSAAAAPWHFSMNYASGEYHIFYHSQADSLGEYSTSTNGVNWSPGGFGVFGAANLIKAGGVEYNFYKNAMRPVPGASGLSWDGLVNTKPATNSNADGWRVKLVRGMVVDTKKLSYQAGNTNIFLIGGESGGSGLNIPRRAALMVIDNTGGSQSQVNIGRTGTGSAGIGFGNSDLTATNAVLYGDLSSFTVIRAPGTNAAMDFRQATITRAGVEPNGGGWFAGVRPTNTVPAGSILATSFIGQSGRSNFFGSADALTNYMGTNIATTSGTAGQILTVTANGARWQNPGSSVFQPAIAKTLVVSNATSILLVSCPNNSRGSLVFDYSIETTTANPTNSGVFMGKLSLAYASGRWGGATSNVLVATALEYAGSAWNFESAGFNKSGMSTPTWTPVIGSAQTNLTLFCNYAWVPEVAGFTNLTLRLSSVQNLSTNMVEFIP